MWWRRAKNINTDTRSRRMNAIQNACQCDNPIDWHILQSTEQLLCVSTSIGKRLHPHTIVSMHLPFSMQFKSVDTIEPKKWIHFHFNCSLGILIYLLAACIFSQQCKKNEGTKNDKKSSRNEKKSFCLMQNARWELIEFDRLHDIKCAILMQSIAHFSRRLAAFKWFSIFTILSDALILMWISL